MQKSLFFKSSFRPYLIPILLLIGSFVMYSYNLGDQPWHIDEVWHLGFGGVYFDLIKEGDFNNQCIKNLADCELLFGPSWSEVNYTPIRNFFVGFGYYLTNGEMKGDYYAWSCMWLPCWDSETQPTPEDFSAGRFFSL